MENGQGFKPRKMRKDAAKKALQRDPHRPEDVMKVDADDTADAFRYLVATKARVVHQRKLRGL